MIQWKSDVFGQHLKMVAVSLYLLTEESEVLTKERVLNHLGDCPEIGRLLNPHNSHNQLLIKHNLLCSQQLGKEYISDLKAATQETSIPDNLTELFLFQV